MHARVAAVEPHHAAPWQYAKDYNNYDNKVALRNCPLTFNRN